MTATQEVCELFDVTVITDIEEPSEGEHTTPCSKLDADGEECTCPPIIVYALRDRGEAGAGLRPVTVSPYFRKQEELEAWCVRNLQNLRPFAEREEIPNATDWV